MRKYIILAISAVVLMTVNTSCLMSGLEKLETYDGKAINSIVGVYYRYIDKDEIIDASGEPAVKQVRLGNAENLQIDEEKGTCTFGISIPENVPADVKPEITAQKLVVILNISTAAVIQPLDGSAKLGVVADWSKANKYMIMAANGTKQEWTVSLTLNK